MMNYKLTTTGNKTLLTFVAVSLKNFFFNQTTKISLISFCSRRVSMNIRRIQFSSSHFRKFFSRFFGHRMSIFPSFHINDITFFRTVFSMSIFYSIRSGFHHLSTHITRFCKCLSMSLQRPSIQRSTFQRATFSFVSFQLRSGLKYGMTIGTCFFNILRKTTSGKIAGMRTILRRCFFRSKWFETFQACFHRYWNYTTNILSIQ